MSLRHEESKSVDKQIILKIVGSETNKTKICDGKKCGIGKHLGNGKYVCIHNNIEVLYPEICKFWNLQLNFNINPRNYLPGSNKEVWWDCENIDCKCKIYLSRIDHKIHNNKKCPCCSKRLCPHNNLTVTHPELCKLWSPINKLGPENYTYGSRVQIWWICLDGCECHIYNMGIYTKVTGANCSFCKHKNPCKHNNLQVLYPEISNEWDPNNDNIPNDYLPYSHETVSWVCSTNNKHKWPAKIKSRTLGKHGCPFCNSGKVSDEYNLLTDNPELCKEWDYEKNDTRPEDHSPHTHIKVWWKCNNNKSHSWPAAIGHRNKKNSNGCPDCSKGSSKMCLDWLSYIMKKNDIKIQDSNNGGEFKIKDIGYVDGFCFETNTVYEFHGDFWHGNPNIYPPEKEHPMNGKLYGDLYTKTIERDKLIILKDTT